MSPGSHILCSWLAAVKFLKNRRERVLVTISGVAPDLDGIGLVIDYLSGTTNLYLKYHHYLGHSILAAIIISGLLSFFAKVQRRLVFWLSFVLIHLHILMDIIGSRSPDGYQWPIYYLYPLNEKYNVTWAGQWELNSWQNYLFFGCLIIGNLYYAITRKLTFLEVFSSKLNQVAIGMYDKYVRR